MKFKSKSRLYECRFAQIQKSHKFYRHVTELLLSFMKKSTSRITHQIFVRKTAQSNRMCYFILAGLCFEMRCMSFDILNGMTERVKEREKIR